MQPHGSAPSCDVAIVGSGPVGGVLVTLLEGRRDPLDRPLLPTNATPHGDQP